MSPATPTMQPERVSRNIVIGAGLLLAVGIAVVSMTIGPSLGSTGQSMVGDRKSTRLNSSHIPLSRMPSSA